MEYKLHNLMKALRIFIFFSLLSCFKIGAQEPFMFHYSVKDGLPSKETYFIFEDSKGYIWICTDAGIAKYNANSFKIFDSSVGLPDNAVFEIFEDKKNRLWFRTLSGGIGYIRNDSVHTISGNKRIREFQGSSIISSFSIDENDNILLGLTSQEECSFIKVSSPYSTTNVQKIFSDQIRSHGIDAIIFGDRIVYAIMRLPEYERPASKEKDMLKIICRDKSGKTILQDTISYFESSSYTKLQYQNSELLLITKFAFIKYNLNTGIKQKNNIGVHLITVMNQKNGFLVGTRNNGLIEFDGICKKESAVHYLLGKSVGSVYVDSNEGYWFATLEDGIYYCPNKNHFKIPLESNLNEKMQITNILKLSDTTLVIGVNTGQIKMLHIKKDNRVSDDLLYEGKDATAFLGQSNASKIIISHSGEYSVWFDLKKGATVKTEKRIPQLKAGILVRNYFVAAAVKELFFYDTSNFSVIKTVPVNDRITGLDFNKQEALLYIAGLSGLYSLNIDTGTVPVKLLSKKVVDVACHENKIFIATKENGLFIKSNAVIDSLNVKAGLLSDICRKLFYYNNELWLISNCGISRIKFDRNKTEIIINYPFSDVLPETIEKITLIKDNLIFFDKGGVVFLPVSQQKLCQPVRIGQVFVNNKLVPLTDMIRLKYNESELAINFEALFFSENKTIQYRYRFNGADSVWKYTDHSSLFFPSLSPGNYELMIQAKDQNNVWVNCEQNLLFFIEKPFWQKWWFITIEFMSGFVLLSMLLFRRYKTKLMEEKTKNELEIRAIRSQMNPHFTFNSLNTIQRFILEKDLTNARQYLSKFSKLLRKVLESGVSDAISINDEIDILNKYLEIEKLRFENSFDYSIINELKNGEQLEIPCMLIQPFVENAIWHGLLPKKGDRKLEIKFIPFDRKRIMCTVDDNGVGRDFKEKQHDPLKKKSQAIDFVNQRLELFGKIKRLNCFVNITDKKNVDSMSLGTKIEILIPILN
jgi:hypothetical protein